MMQDRKLEDYVKSHSSAFRFVEAFSVVRDFSDLPSGLQIVLKLAERPEKSAARRSLKFFGVRDLRIKNLEMTGGLHLEIRSVRGDGLEGISYRVVDTEHEILAFLCGDFSILDAGSDQ